jgi:hypothetical protein
VLLNMAFRLTNALLRGLSLPKSRPTYIVFVEAPALPLKVQNSIPLYWRLLTNSADVILFHQSPTSLPSDGSGPAPATCSPLSFYHHSFRHATVNLVGDARLPTYLPYPACKKIALPNPKPHLSGEAPAAPLCCARKPSPRKAFLPKKWPPSCNVRHSMKMIHHRYRRRCWLRRLTDREKDVRNMRYDEMAAKFGWSPRRKTEKNAKKKKKEAGKDSSSAKK